MFFENFHEEIGKFDVNIIDDFKKKLFNVDLSDPKLNRPEYCFKDGGKLIVPLHYTQVRNEEFYQYVEPLIKVAQGLNHHCLRNTRPFRVEISIIEPEKNVLWHHDQHLVHKFSERIHFPIITNDDVDFFGKWYLDKQIYKYKMSPGTIYRFNNRVMHKVNNPNKNFRCHVMVDFIHEGVWKYFLNSGNVEKLTSISQISPADEIYYFVNANAKGVTSVQATDDDINQLKNLKNY